MGAKRVLGEGPKFPYVRKLFSARKKKNRPSHGASFPFERQAFFLRTEGIFPSEENQFSEAGKLLFVRRKKGHSSEGKMPPSEGRKTSVRPQKNFYAHKNKFPCARKFIFFRKEILRLPQRAIARLERIDTEAPKEGRSEALREGKTPISRYFTRGLDALPLRP